MAKALSFASSSSRLTKPIECPGIIETARILMRDPWPLTDQLIGNRGSPLSRH
jgi:hypothetical protein